jgi:4-amino-4-deoxy-L-arabinose transferase-like glycosyltransferase
MVMVVIEPTGTSSEGSGRSSRSLLATTLWLSALGALAVVYRLLTLGAYPLSDNTEARYAEIARRMMASGDWVTLRLPGDVAFWGKPPLSTWFSALGQELLGANEWGARLPVLLCAVLTSLLVWRLAAESGRRVAALSICLLWGSVLFFVAAGAVMTDMALALSVTLSLCGFWWAISATSLRGVRVGAISLFVGLGLGLLAKGPVALVLCFIPIAAHALSARDAWRDVVALPWGTGLLVIAIIAAPWYVMAELRSPGFLEYFFVGEHWRRFTQPGWSGDLYGTAHQQPRGLVWIFLAAGWVPWTFLVPWLLIGRQAAIKRSLAEHTRSPSPDRAMLVAWALAPALLFSVSRNILWTYVLPALPAVALLSARWLAKDPRRALVHGVVSAGVALVIGTSVPLLMWQVSLGAVRSAAAILLPLRAAGHAVTEVFFLDAVPYSASFYTEGGATRVVTRQALPEWLRIQPVPVPPGHEHKLLFASAKSWRDLPESTRASLSMVSESAGYVLLAQTGSSPNGLGRP